MENKNEKMSDKQFIEIFLEKVGKCYLGKKFRRETIQLPGKNNPEPSPINKVSHIIYGDKVINEDNIKRNFSQEQINMMLKGTKELIWIVENEDRKLSINEKRVDNSSKKYKIEDSSEKNSANVLIEKKVNENQVEKENFRKEMKSKSCEKNKTKVVPLEKEVVNDKNKNVKGINKKVTEIVKNNNYMSNESDNSSHKIKNVSNTNSKDRVVINNRLINKKVEPFKDNNQGEKLLKNKTLNTVKKYNLGNLQQSGCYNADVLNKPFVIEDEYIFIHLYSIEIVQKDNYEKDQLISSNKQLNKETFGIITQEDFGIIPIFKLLNPVVINEKIFKIEHVEIKYLKKKRVKKNNFHYFVNFHNKLFDDLYERKDNLIVDINRLFSTKGDERKYIITPLIKSNNVWEIDIIKINIANSFIHNDFSSSKTVREVLNHIQEENKYSSENEIRNKTHEFLKLHLIFSDYKFNLYYYQHIYFLEDNSSIFFKQTAEVSIERFKENEIKTREMKDLINVLKVRYFKSNDIQIIEENKISYLVLESETNSESLVYYRKLNEKFNLKIDYKTCPFIMVLPVKSIVNNDFSYNCNFSLKHSNHNLRKLKTKYKTDSSIYPILPIDIARIYFLTKKQWKFGSKLPSILIQFERYILTHQMINNSKLLSSPATECDLKHFTASISSPAMMEDYNYEILETLGDSVLKFIITFYLFEHFPEFNEGDISKKRNDLTKNNYLYQKGSSSSLVNYISTSPINLKNWDPPLKFKHLQKHEFTLSKKNMADVIEAVMGACYLSNDMFSSCLVYMKYVDILNVNVKFSDIYLSKLLNFKKDSLLDLKFKSIAFEEDISFLDLYNCFAAYTNDFEPENTLRNSYEIKNIGCNINSNPSLEDGRLNEILSQIEEKSLNYRFKDKSLLKDALSHKSYDRKNNYERLEILGDSILEFYILSTIFHLSGDEGRLDDNFNPGSLSKSKAFLASNYFLLRLSVFFKLHENMFVISKMYRNLEIANKYIKNLNFNRKLNEYEDSGLERPKIVSDIFESVIGAIFVDADLNECFRLLNIMLGPFVVYCAKYLGKLKYSPIAEFVEMSQVKYKASPSFVSKKGNNNEYIIEASVENKIIAKGCGASEDSAKENACINGLKKMKLNIN